MPKLKTHSRSKKTFSITGSGEIKRFKAFKSHILTKKSNKRKRNLRKSTLVDATNKPMIKRLLAIGG